MIFEFAKYTEITNYVLENFKEQYVGYSRFFICPDVHDFQFIRVLPNHGEDYEKDNTKIIAEHQMFPMSRKGENLTIKKLYNLLENDDLSNWDYHVFHDIDELIERIDDGFGINNLETTSNLA